MEQRMPAILFARDSSVQGVAMRWAVHETVNGGINSDFPVTGTGRLCPRTLDVNLGSGGPLFHVSTTNGAVRLQRI